MLPIKNTQITLSNGQQVSAFGYDATLKDLDVGKIRAYLDVDTVVIAEITPRAFREMLFADGLLRATLDMAADQNILFYQFHSDLLPEIPSDLWEMGYQPQGDYIFRFFVENKHCSGDCANCGQR